MREGEARVPFQVKSSPQPDPVGSSGVEAGAEFVPARGKGTVLAYPAPASLAGLPWARELEGTCRSWCLWVKKLMFHPLRR